MPNMGFVFDPPTLGPAMFGDLAGNLIMTFQPVEMSDVAGLQDVTNSFILATIPTALPFRRRIGRDGFSREIVGS